MKDFYYAPAKMIGDYNDTKENGNSKIEKTDDTDIIKMTQVKIGQESSSNEYDMSLKSLHHMKKKLMYELSLVNDFIEECKEL